MAKSDLRPQITVWVIIALGAAAWALIGVIFASLLPPQMVPQLFHNHHAEHAAAFYLVSILLVAGLPMVRLPTLGGALVALAVLLELARMLLPHLKSSTGENLLSDLTGILAALLPVLIGRLRLASEAAGIAD